MFAGFAFTELAYTELPRAEFFNFRIGLSSPRVVELIRGDELSIRIGNLSPYSAGRVYANVSCGLEVGISATFILGFWNGELSLASDWTDGDSLSGDWTEASPVATDWTPEEDLT